MILKDLDTVSYHPVNEDMLNILKIKVQNSEADLYFRVLSSFFLAQMASSMRVSIKTEHRGTLPVNLFVCGLMESGGGKGHSMNILEENIMGGFKKNFMNYTYPIVSEQAIEHEAHRKANLNSTEVEDEKEALMKEFISYGPMPFTFDSGTSPAFKQIRTKAQIARIGSLNMICDEIGTNLLGNAELFAVNLEAYDVGKIKQKITKQSSENKRAEERDDPVPSNMIIFGTPSKLFNGGKEEAEFMSLQETGYARRLIFAVGKKTVAQSTTAEEIYAKLTDKSIDSSANALSVQFANLADQVNYNKKLILEEPVALINIEYQRQCEMAAAKLPKFEHIRKAEMQHRYFKALKLAGAYAFVDGTYNITEDQMYAAIKLIEDSGKAFEEILTRPKNYARLAMYLAEVGKEVTMADLVEDLPFFSGSNSAKQDMLSLATAWGHKKNIIIKKSYLDSIEFYKGETLKETDLNKMMISYSNDVAYGYRNQVAPFEQLHKLTGVLGLHWVNHFLINGDDPQNPNGHRNEENIKAGFNLIVIDCDGTVSQKQAEILLKDYKYLLHTTKRHTPESNRFRIMIPMTHHLSLTAEDFKEFMNNIYEWLPFDVDFDTNQRSRKWTSHNSEQKYNDGKMLDPLPFIPKTTKNQSRIKEDKALGNLGKVERWFAKSWAEGGRNNTLVKYALMLLDSGRTSEEVREGTLAFNKSMPNPLSENEVSQTILRTVANKAAKAK